MAISRRQFALFLGSLLAAGCGVAMAEDERDDDDDDDDRRRRRRR